MRVSSLFSGAGALDLGLEKAGHEVIFLCESDPGARQVLRERFPGVRLAENVCSVEALPEETELLAAGFPCVDVSRAGLRKGLDGQSTGLVRHVFRLLRVAKERKNPVPWVLLENVEALLDRIDDQPPVMAYVVQQIMELGYSSWAYRVVAAAGFGVPMRRRRVFLVASMHGDARDVLLTQGMYSCPGSCMKLFDGLKCYKCHQESLKERNSNEDVSFAIDLGCAICKPGEDIIPSFTTANDRILLLLADGRSGLLRIEDAERLQGLPEGWTRPCFPITPEGISSHKRIPHKEGDLESHNSRRWQLLGNAVTVHIGRWLGERLNNPYAYKYRYTRGTFDIDDLITEDSNQPRGTKRSPNIWSFVTVDEIQEAAIFSFQESKFYKEAKLRKLQRLENEFDANESREMASGQFEADEEVQNTVSENATQSQFKSSEPGSDIENSTITPDKIQDQPRVHHSDTDAVDESFIPYKHRFQATMMNKIRRGTVQSTSKDKAAIWDKCTWPKCGWWQNGIGAFGVTCYTECPIITPFQPLGEFIEHLGRSSSAEERAGYVHRLKEKGWNLSEELLDRLSGNKKGIASKCAQINRISGLLDDAEMVGDIVWVKDSVSGVYWPGEALDPFDMPLGRSIPTEALSKLSSEQLRDSVPSLDGTWKPNKKSDARRIFVMYFPLDYAKWQWYHPDETLPWQKHRVKYERACHKEIKNSKFKYTELLTNALKDARESHGVKNNANNLSVNKMRQTRAATASAGVDLKKRCGRCRSCMNAYAGTKRHDCLTQRMTASALGGHAGGQLAICGENAVGARIAVWWDGDESYFEGVICWYDPVSTEHTVAYDDGEIGMHRLWQHDEHIVLKNKIADWPAEAVAVKERLKRAMQEPISEDASSSDALNSKRASELASRMPQLTSYEKERQKNIKHIKEKFKLFLGLDALEASQVTKTD